MAAALTIKDITLGQKLRMASKNDPKVKYKVTVDKILKAAGKVEVTVYEGDNEGKNYTISVERLSKPQGRQPGFSPTAAKKEVAAEKPAAKKPAGKAKVVAKEETEELSLKSAKAELLDLAELLRDLAARSEKLHSFLDTYNDPEEDSEDESEDADESEEEEESPAPAPKKGKAKKPAPMSEDD